MSADECMAWDASETPVCPSDIFLPGMRAPCFYSDGQEVEEEDGKEGDGNDGFRQSRSVACLPSFFIPGFAKAGTSALAWILGSHPQVRKTSPKEIHYWDFIARKGSNVSSLDAYAAKFRRDVAGLGIDGVTFDATPGLVRLGLGARLRAAMPRATQTVVAVREPTRWLLSCLRFHCKDVSPSGVDVPYEFHAWVGHALRAKLHAARHNTTASAVLADARAQGRAAQGFWCPAADTPLLLDRTFVLHSGELSTSVASPVDVEGEGGENELDKGTTRQKGLSSPRLRRRVRVTCPWVDQLSTWISAFPLGSHTHVVFAEALAADPRSTMDAVVAFLGLEPHAWDDSVLYARVNDAQHRGPRAVAPTDDKSDAPRPPRPMQQTFVRLWPFHSVCARHLAELLHLSPDDFPLEWRYLLGRSA